MADADDLRTVGTGAGDEAADLAGADIERGEDAAARPLGELLRPRHSGARRLGARGFEALDRHVFFAAGRPFFAGSLGGSRVTRTTRRPGSRIATRSPSCTT